ncbi:hypothetical protein RBB79_21075 [Tunturiibacter empetritectus]|uniref:Uncharacterized protein n=2 Tax=Tunturiibacter TaxID=3154218 RepID=A0A852VS87_9BACT|nr:hypothetical protein [Edaphobacter lichenicola]NYF92182.1 hypothetical protein [Edaphobacter lichenicola]
MTGFYGPTAAGNGEEANLSEQDAGPGENLTATAMAKTTATAMARTTATAMARTTARSGRVGFYFPTHRKERDEWGTRFFGGGKGARAAKLQVI